MVSTTRQRWLYVVTDWVTTSASFLLFNIYRFYTLNLSTREHSTLDRFLWSDKILAEQIAIPLLCLFIYWLSGYYNRPFHKSRLQELVTTFLSALLNTAIIFLLLLTNDMVALKSVNYSLLGVLFLLLLVLPLAGRSLITWSALRSLRRRKWLFPTVIVGSSPRAARMAQTLREARANLGYNVLGHLPIAGETRHNSDLTILDMEQVERLSREGKASQLVVVPEEPDAPGLASILNTLFRIGLPIKIAPGDLSLLTSGIHLQDIFGEPFVDVSSPRMSESGKNVKRTMDVAVSLLALTLLSLPMAITALLVRLTSKGPVIYRQKRVGYRGKEFTIYKFRSMRTDAEKDGPALSSDHDPRITPLGRVMRKYRIDELPQFWNVLKGDMSLVGPRPEREFFMKQLRELVPWYPMLLQVRPGITSWGIVKSGYCTTVEQMVERCRFDLVYLANMSISVDLKILIYTVQTVITGRGK